MTKTWGIAAALAACAIDASAETLNFQETGAMLQTDNTTLTATADNATLNATADNATDNATPATAVDTTVSMSKERMTEIEKEARRIAYEKKYGGYTPKKEFSIGPAPLVAFGLLSMAEKKKFRTAHEKFVPFYKNGLDDYLQFGPVVVSTILNVAGYEGRSNFVRYVASAGASYVVMAALVNGLKYSVRQMRPDGSTPNSFPSGHTATAFTAATILHKEYGLTRSPWWSVLGYATAATTGIMRTLNNRHWISDVLVGAGIGIISTDIGYAIVDMIMKDKGIKRKPREFRADLINNPSFFRLSLGMQGLSNIELKPTTSYTTTMQVWNQSGASLDNDYFTVVRNGNPFRIPDDFENRSNPTYNNYSSNNPAVAEGTAPTIHTSMGTTVGVEGAYFINPYVGFGLRGRITTSSVYTDDLYCYDTRGLVTGTVGSRLSNYTAAADVWSIADIGIGVYGSLPLTPRHSIGGKVLYGRRFYGSLDLQASYDLSFRVKGDTEVYTENMAGDDLEISSTNADGIGAGISYTYAAGSGMALSAFVDYDYSKPQFDITYTPYNTDAEKMLLTQSRFSHKQKIHSLTIGASMVIMF